MINLDGSGLKNKTGATASQECPVLQTTEQQHALHMANAQIEQGQDMNTQQQPKQRKQIL